MAFSDVKFILNIGQQGERHKKDHEKKKRPAGMSREIFNLVSGLPDDCIQMEQPALKEKKVNNSSIGKWVYASFENSARNDHLLLSHWCRVEDVKDKYPYARLNKKIDLIQYSEEEYESIISKIESTWTKEETDCLWKLLEQFDMRFIVIHDRFQHKFNRTIEDLKQRYYSVAQAIFVSKNQNESPEFLKNFNYENELKRRQNQEYMLTKSSDELSSEKMRLKNIKEIEIQIKKEEKVLNSLKKAKARQEFKESNLKEQNLEILQVEESGPRGVRRDLKSNVYLKSEIINSNLLLPENVQKQVNLLLNEFGLSNIIPTKECCILYDNLKSEIVNMLNYQSELDTLLEEKKFLENSINKAKQNQTNLIYQVDVEYHLPEISIFITRKSTNSKIEFNNPLVKEQLEKNENTDQTKPKNEIKEKRIYKKRKTKYTRKKISKYLKEAK